MNCTRLSTIRRLASAFAGLATALLGTAAAAPAAFALPVPPGGGGDATVPPPPVQTVVGGMPGWQIALIAVSAAVLAAALAVILDRAWNSRRQLAAPSM